MFTALLLAGCTTQPSRFASDPRAAIIGPAYLDVIADNPRDCHTQFYYPAFTRDLPGWTDPTSTLPPNPFPEISPLLTDIPAAAPEVRDIAGKGYPDLERKGIRLFTALPN